MNWSIREKIFTYFYNIFRPANHMHYIKCDVNSSLLVYFWLLQKVCCTLDHCFTMTQFSKRGWFTNLLWYDILRSKAPCTGSHHIWRTYTLPFLSPQEHRWQCSWVDDFTSQCLLWRLSSRKTFFPPHMVFQPIWGWGDLSSLQLPQSNSSPEGAWNLGGYI